MDFRWYMGISVDPLPVLGFRSFSVSCLACQSSEDRYKHVLPTSSSITIAYEVEGS